MYMSFKLCSYFFLSAGKGMKFFCLGLLLRRFIWSILLKNAIFLFELSSEFRTAVFRTLNLLNIHLPSFYVLCKQMKVQSP